MQPQVHHLHQELQHLRSTMHHEMQQLRQEFQSQLATFEQRLSGMVHRAVAEKLAELQANNSKQIHASAAPSSPLLPAQSSSSRPSYDPAKAHEHDLLPVVPQRRSSMMWGDDFIDGNCEPLDEHDAHQHVDNHYALQHSESKNDLPSLTPRSTPAPLYPLQSPLLNSDSIWSMPSGATVDTQTLASHIGLTSAPPATQLHMSQDKLVWLAVKILLEQQSLPVGKLGSLLHRAANDHKLPQVLKQQFGGLKKFLQSHDSFFVLSSDHAFNPTVQLNTELHRQLKSYQQQQFASQLGITLTPKIPDITNHNVNLSDRAQSQEVSKQTPLAQPLHRVSSVKTLPSPPISRSSSTPACSPFPTPSPVQPVAATASGWHPMGTKSVQSMARPASSCGRSMLSHMAASQQQQTSVATAAAAARLRAEIIQHVAASSDACRRKSPSNITAGIAYARLTDVLAIDCEMVGVGINGERSQLARVSIVNYHGHTVYDSYVRPVEMVTDYRSHVSGIRPTDLMGPHVIDFSKVQTHVQALLHNRIVVAHDICHDLAALQIYDIPRALIRDTSIYDKYCPRNSVALKTLVAKHLDGFGWSDFQLGEHSSVSDSRASLELYKRVEYEWELQLFDELQQRPTLQAEAEEIRTQQVVKQVLDLGSDDDTDINHPIFDR